jgi:hypothetical protein
MLGKNIWFTQQKIADTFGLTKSIIGEHFMNNFEIGVRKR